MKNLHLSFETTSDFVSFLMTLSSLRITTGFAGSSLFPETFHNFPFGLAPNFSEIEIREINAIYVISKCEPQQKIAICLTNFAISEAQENYILLSIHDPEIKELAHGKIATEQYLLKNLPAQFLMMTGWRTDPGETVFTKK